ncbi:unnamed protein product [Urochloa decumbens]|uniref:Uncharacterized protein n=1 Tax=Urochloa decumbens TaxID=240449 RepID=A0ABC9C6B6_9POAL
MVLKTSELGNMGFMAMFDGKRCMVTRIELNWCILHCWRSVGFEIKLWELATGAVFMMFSRSQGLVTIFQCGSVLELLELNM